MRVHCTGKGLMMSSAVVSAAFAVAEVSLSGSDREEGRDGVDGARTLGIPSRRIVETFLKCSSADCGERLSRVSEDSGAGGGVLAGETMGCWAGAGCANSSRCSQMFSRSGREPSASSNCSGAGRDAAWCSRGKSYGSWIPDAGWGWLSPAVTDFREGWDGAPGGSVDQGRGVGEG